MKKILVCLIVLLTELTNINAGKETTLQLPKRPRSVPGIPNHENFLTNNNNLKKFLKEKYGPFEKEE